MNAIEISCDNYLKLLVGHDYDLKAKFKNENKEVGTLKCPEDHQIRQKSSSLTNS